MAYRKFRFSSIGSGSKGNGLIVEYGRTKLMLDCGFGLREAVRRLLARGVAPESLDAILVTHEHVDHIGGVEKLSKKYNLPVFLTSGTLQAMVGKFDFFKNTQIYGYEKFEIGDFSITPFPVPHDAREPAQFVFSNGTKKLGVLTDVGRRTRHLESILAGCNALVLECNHDTNLLAKSPYPRVLKKRISGGFGHLSNDEAADILSRINSSKLRHIVAAHLSESNNTPELVKESLSAAVNTSLESIGVADQENGFDWLEI